MVKLEDTIKLGNAYFLAVDVYNILDIRAKRVDPEDIENLTITQAVAKESKRFKNSRK